MWMRFSYSSCKMNHNVFKQNHKFGNFERFGQVWECPLLLTQQWIICNVLRLPSTGPVSRIHNCSCSRICVLFPVWNMITVMLVSIPTLYHLYSLQPWDVTVLCLIYLQLSWPKRFILLSLFHNESYACTVAMLPCTECIFPLITFDPNEEF